MGSERVLNLLLFLGCFLGPNWTPKWSQKGSKIGPKMGSAAQMCSWSPKWAPKWTQNGSGVPKWTQNGSQMAPKCDIRIRLATDPWHVAGPGGMRVALTITDNLRDGKDLHETSSRKRKFDKRDVGRPPICIAIFLANVW